MKKPSFVILLKEDQRSGELCPFPDCYVSESDKLFWFSSVFTEDLHFLPGIIHARMHATNIHRVP